MGPFLQLLVRERDRRFSLVSGNSWVGGVFPARVNEQESGVMKKTDKRKQSLYFPEEMLREIQTEANRQDRSLSWIVQQAWRVSREEIKKFPSVNDMIGEESMGGI
jgi:uncharacterized small protein (TIGR04563 family)